MRPKLMLEISNISDVEISSYKIYITALHMISVTSYLKLFEEKKLIYISYMYKNIHLLV